MEVPVLPLSKLTPKPVAKVRPASEGETEGAATEEV